MKQRSEQFADQSGVASMDPSPLVRWIASAYMRRMVAEGRLLQRRAKAETARRKAGEPHVVEYFHQVDDGYSHLAAQLLPPLLATYDVELVCHLVTGPAGNNSPEPELLLDLSRYEATRVAPHYGLQFPPDSGKPEAAAVQLAQRALAAADADTFAEVAVSTGDALWWGSTAQLSGLVADSVAQGRVAAGNARRAELGHYSGGMFYYGGEWYWGVDRFYHLENRLIELGALREPATSLIAPRPEIVNGPLQDNGSLTLEIYPSLRSPYTSFIFDKAVGLARDTGVRLVVRPVLPMVMRGVPATREKGRYIFSDAAREARALGLDWGDVYDPIGEPVRRCYSLYQWAREQGRDIELLSAFLEAAFSRRVNTNTAKGMRHVVERAGLSWEAAQTVIDNDDWQAEIEANRLAMYGFGCWGVPSFRLFDAYGEAALALWGQDRLWLIAREIQRLLAAPGAVDPAPGR